MAIDDAGAIAARAPVAIDRDDETVTVCWRGQGVDDLAEPLDRLTLGPILGRNAANKLRVAARLTLCPDRSLVVAPITGDGLIGVGITPEGVTYAARPRKGAPWRFGREALTSSQALDAAQRLEAASDEVLGRAFRVRSPIAPAIRELGAKTIEISTAPSAVVGRIADGRSVWLFALSPEGAGELAALLMRAARQVAGTTQEKSA